MTKERAGELVLAGEAFCVCPSCAGSGSVLSELVKFNAGLQAGTSLTAPKDCPECAGYGAILHPDYVMACRELGKELPFVRPVAGSAKSKSLQSAAIWNFDGNLKGEMRDPEIKLGDLVALDGQVFGFVKAYSPGKSR